MHVLFDITFVNVTERMEREHLAQSCSHHDNFDKLYSYIQAEAN